MACKTDDSGIAVTILKKRAEFLAVQHHGVKQVSHNAVLQAVSRKNGRQGVGVKPAIGVGFTASRKVGNAVERNRAKRRLRAWVRLNLHKKGIVGVDYVFIARQNILSESWPKLENNLERAMSGVNQKIERKHKAHLS